MFRRRKKQSSVDQLRGLMFPRKGWKRPFYYIYYRIRRRPGGPRRIATGVACGVAVSFTPFIGFHLAIGYLLTIILGGDVTAMVIGTLIGNPWTFPFFWIAGYYLGRFLIGVTLPETTPEALENLSFNEILSQPEGLLLPMSVGGVTLGVIFGLITFFIVHTLVKAYKVHREKMLKKRRSDLKKRMTDILKNVEKDEIKK